MEALSTWVLRCGQPHQPAVTRCGNDSTKHNMRTQGADASVRPSRSWVGLGLARSSQLLCWRLHRTKESRPDHVVHDRGQPAASQNVLWPPDRAGDCVTWIEA